MLERMWGKGNSPALLVGVQAGTAPLDISMVISQKIRKQPSLRPRNTTFWYMLNHTTLFVKADDVFKEIISIKLQRFLRLNTGIKRRENQGKTPPNNAFNM